jgi:hypothetical protein
MKSYKAFIQIYIKAENIEEAVEEVKQSLVNGMALETVDILQVAEIIEKKP